MDSRMSMSDLMRMEFKQAFEEFDKVPDTGYRIQYTGYRILDTGYWIQDTGYRILDTGYRILDTGYWILDTICLLYTSPSPRDS